MEAQGGQYGLGDGRVRSGEEDLERIGGSFLNAQGEALPLRMEDKGVLGRVHPRLVPGMVEDGPADGEGRLAGSFVPRVFERKAEA